MAHPDQQNSQDLVPMRHSLAHIMATAVQHLWPEAKFGVGPAVENGFYYDIDLGDVTLSEDDFKRIEKEMRKVIAGNQDFVRSEKPVDEAIAWAREHNQPYKEELLNDLKRAGTTAAKDLDAAQLGVATDYSDRESAVENVSFYTNGDFTDLCRGPHVERTGVVGAFKLMRVAGAYWRGKDSNPQMQRLYGVAFATNEELDQYLHMLEEAKKRDHRKLGRDLDLFAFSELVGAGLPLFTPRGTVLREKLSSFAEQLRRDGGFQRVSIPHITKTDLYKVSGHWDKFGGELFITDSQQTSDSFALKPMNCPHHNQIYASSPRSYKDLPIKYFETTTVYRDEKTGELGGLNRVRSITQDDSHAYVREDQVEEVVGQLIANINKIYDETLNMPLKASLSFRDDSDKYLGDRALWEKAQDTIRALAVSNNLDYFEVEGEAAFYGPKIDFMASDALGREHQVATVQLDFVQPERFQLSYNDHESQEQRPVMIHCALLGSVERFLSVYIEHTAGWFPFWLAPEQIRILTINDTVLEYVDKITAKLANVTLMDPLKYNELRYSVDARNESLGKKIREATNMKIPVQLIVGPKDVEAGEVSVRTREGEQKVALDGLADFLGTL
ncbi:MAG TPA: threonine--tRNA ligase [Candidatus Saccharimonadales bacterium]|nr:threonine--tRNA ligase [Candidatus Saccharimonadales bacterium]